MIFAVVYSDKRILKDLTVSIRRCCPDCEVNGFTNPTDVQEFAFRKGCDVLITETVLPQPGGIILAEKMKKANPSLQVIFITTEPQFALDAIHLDAAGFLLKPYSHNELLELLDKVKKQELLNRIESIYSQDELDRIAGGSMLDNSILKEKR